MGTPESVSRPGHGPGPAPGPGPRKYIVVGFYADRKPEHRGKPPAELPYDTLDEAMRKLRDLVEADEIDTDGPMFAGYAIRMDPLPRAEWDTDEYRAEEAAANGGDDDDDDVIAQIGRGIAPGNGVPMPAGGVIPPPKPPDSPPQLRLRRE
jgi:alkanesulfonate monooxygenase SsuD/methylene tetrahydromethanopterin reductase-like flavin-dependent oxidoreductase (luciferase family)